MKSVSKNYPMAVVIKDLVNMQYVLRPIKDIILKKILPLSFLFFKLFKQSKQDTLNGLHDTYI